MSTEDIIEQTKERIDEILMIIEEENKPNVNRSQLVRNRRKEFYTSTLNINELVLAIYEFKKETELH